jgi:N-carbamoyl-L-amino-acid hydrolase
MTEKPTINSARLWQSIMDMAKIDALPGGGCGRLALSNGDLEARTLFTQWCEEAGCCVTYDRLGNMFSRREGRDKTALPIAIGSHLDTQPHGGKFDGVFGVMAGLEIVRTLNDLGIETEAPIEIVNWTNEEGARFAPAMLGSGVYAGLFDLDFALGRRDTNGASLADELDRIGYAGAQTCGAHEMGAFLEAHIEQGPILERHDEIIGVVSGGQGQRWYDVTVTGRDAHSGSTPMQGRRDALVTAARLIQDVQQIALSYGPDGVGTVGEVHILPNSRNTIPGEVTFTIDFRHHDDAILSGMDYAIRQTVAAQTEANVDLNMVWYNPPVSFDDHCVKVIEQAARNSGLAWRRMISGAGHDSSLIARKVPTAMVFVPCRNGLSHNEAEWAEPEHLAAGCNVLFQAVLTLANQ